MCPKRYTIFCKVSAMKIRQLLRKHRELIAYIFWGVATTVVNYIVYFLCTRALGIHYVASNVISWAVSVAFAFYVNKQFVFQSTGWQAKVVLGELWKFVSARILSGFLETGMLFVFVELLRCNDVVIKVLASILVVISNYVVSKLMIFTKK